MTRRTITRWWLACVGLGAAGALSYALLGGSSPSPAQRPAPDPAVPVTVAEAVRKPMPIEIETIGRSRTIASVPIRTRIEGVIARVHVEDGQAVEAGDLLFTLDERALEAAVLRAEANLARDRAMAANARLEAERMAPLLAKDFVSRQRMDQLKVELETARATVKAAEAALEAARIELSYASIRAPIDGRLGTINFKTGNAVRPNDSQPLVLLNQIRPIYVGFSVAQRHLEAVRSAMPGGRLLVRAAPSDHGGRPAEGMVAYIENAVDAQTNTFNISARFENADELLWPGQFVNVSLVLGIEDDAVVVPLAAVRPGQDSPFVFVVTPDRTVEVRPIRVDRHVGPLTVVGEGVEPGERVVTEGHLRLDDGSRIRLRSESAGEGAGAGHDS